MSERRKDKSLYTLTKKFVELLKTEETVDLNNVTSELNCSKKRRIYDVSNVLEGIGLIHKTHKNLYKYTGKTYKDTDGNDHERLERFRDEKRSLENLEKELDTDLQSMKMNFEALTTYNTYKYLTKNDFLKAFGQDKSLLVIQDSRKINVVFKEDDINSPPLVQVMGYIVKPITVKLVNTLSPENMITEVDLDAEYLNNNVDSVDETSEDPQMFNSNKKMKTSDGLILFKRSFKSKTYLEEDQATNESISANVLSHMKYEGKSKFHYVNCNKLVLPSDYTCPNFIDIEPPVDADYEENYSVEPPSIIDLFDCNDESESAACEETMEVDDEMFEEEYIIEELDEESLKMLQ